MIVLSRVSSIVVLSCSVLAAAAVPVLAECREDILTVADYAFKDADDGKVELAFTLKSAQGKPIRLVDGKFGLRDALGGPIGAIALDRDVAIPAGGTFASTMADNAKDWARLTKVNRADIVPYACVRGVIYDDGTSEQF